MEKVKEYIESQRTDEHKRKYIKTGKYKKAGKQPASAIHLTTDSCRMEFSC